MFYGFEHAYGEQACDSQGNDIGQCVKFATRRERDTWVRQRYTEQSTQTGYRVAYPARKARRWPNIEYGTIR